MSAFIIAKKGIEYSDSRIRGQDRGVSEQDSNSGELDGWTSRESKWEKWDAHGKEQCYREKECRDYDERIITHW